MKDTEILKEIQAFHTELRNYNDSLKSEFYKAHTDVLLKIKELPRHEDFTGYKAGISKKIDDLKDNISKLFSKVNSLESSLSSLSKDIKSEKEFKGDVLEMVNNFVSSESGQSAIFKTVSKEQTEKEKGQLHKMSYLKGYLVPLGMGVIVLLTGGIVAILSNLNNQSNANQASLSPPTQVVQQLQGGK